MKIGIVGWACKTGNGLWNFDLASIPQVTRWLALSHPSHGIDHELVGNPDVHDKVILSSPSGDTRAYMRFLRSIDVLLFVETPYIKGFDLVGRAKAMGVTVACIPMWEWFNPANRWTRQVEVMFASTERTVQHLEQCRANLEGQRCDWKNSIHFIRPGLWLNDFPFVHRVKASRFVFVNGRGGINGRKGIVAVAEAARRLKHVDFVVYSQKKKIPGMPNNVELRGEVKNRQQLYEDGDVFIYPSSLEGLAHQIYEAMACGMPVITTNAAPMNEPPAARLIDVGSIHEHQVGGQSISFNWPKIDHFVELIDGINGTDITGESYAARNWVEQNYDRANSVHEMLEVITGESEKGGGAVYQPL